MDFNELPAAEFLLQHFEIPYTISAHPRIGVRRHEWHGLIYVIELRRQEPPIAVYGLNQLVTHIKKIVSEVPK